MAEEKTERIRSFIAIALDPALVEAVARVQQQLQRLASSSLVRWAPPEQLHLTLTFLGNVQAAKTCVLEQSLRRAVTGITPFQLSFDGLGCFPSSQKPSVCWIGISGQVETLMLLQQRVDAVTRDAGSHAEVRKFHPHLTIGRVKHRDPASHRLGQVLREFRIPLLGQWRVNEIQLMRSELSPKGAVYTQLAAFRLIGSD